jgi:energy-coupling factor transport system permease protein
LALAGVNHEWKFKGAILVTAIVWSTVLSQSLFYGLEPRTPLLELGPIVFWREGVQHGLIQSMRFIGVGLAGIALATSTPPDRLLLAMQRLGIPSGVCFLSVTALRFIPTVGREIMLVRAARKQRSAVNDSPRLWAWLKLETQLMMPVLARSLRRARSLGESMHIRGFEPSAQRRSRHGLAWGATETGLLIASGLIFTLILTTKALFFLYVIDVHYAPVLRPLYGVARNWL